MVAWWQLEHARLGSGFQLQLERASCQSGHPGRVPGLTLPALLSRPYCELLVSLAPLCWAPETWLQAVGPGGLRPWNWGCPLHCKSFHTAGSLLEGFRAPPGVHRRGPVFFSAPALQIPRGRGSLGEVRPGPPLSTSFRQAGGSVRKA